jgi:hypothetical protein
MAPTAGRKNRKKECNEANFKEPKIKWKKSDANGCCRKISWRA